jgi:hypothetical protein
MQYEIPTVVTLMVIPFETAQSFMRRAMMRSAYEAGLPLLEQVYYANHLISLGWLFQWKVGDPTPQDNINIKDAEITSRANGAMNYWLSEAEKEELKNRQANFVLNGGVLGTGLESRADFQINLNLNIIYDENQYSLEQAQNATVKTLKYLQDSYGSINIIFNVSYSAGKGDASYMNFNGVYGRILKGAMSDKISVLLFANNKYAGRSGSLYNPDTELIVVWEGSMDANPRSQNVSDGLSSSAIAHELGHLFFHYAGLSMEQIPGNNLVQDGGIRYALSQMKFNPLFTKDSQLPDNFEYKKAKKGGFYPIPGKTKYNPTSEQLLRLGAKRLSAKL